MRDSETISQHDVTESEFTEVTMSPQISRPKRAL
jgi:hypothetical protein